MLLLSPLAAMAVLVPRRDRQTLRRRADRGCAPPGPVALAFQGSETGPGKVGFMAHTSLIGAGTELSGRLTVDADLHFEGRIQGDIAVRGDLAVGARASVDGALRARKIVVAGGVRGPVHGEECVEIVRGGSVQGDIRSACVVLGAGSELDGRIEILP